MRVYPVPRVAFEGVARTGDAKEGDVFGWKLLCESVDFDLEAAIGYDDDKRFLVLIVHRAIGVEAKEKELAEDRVSVEGFHEALGEVDLPLPIAGVAEERDRLCFVVLVVGDIAELVDRRVHKRCERGLYWH